MTCGTNVLQQQSNVYRKLLERYSQLRSKPVFPLNN